MNIQTITAKYVNPPKPGKRFGSVKTADGGMFVYEASKVQPPTGTFVANVDQQNWSGSPVQVIMSIDAQPQAPVAGQPAAPTAPTAPAIPSTVTDKDVGIFVMAVIGKAFEGTGTIPDEASLTDMVRRCGRAFRAGMAPRVKTQSELDDEIPY